MRYRRTVAVVGTLVLGLLLTCTARANDSCKPQWVPTFGGTTGVEGKVWAVSTFDDGWGDGPALFVAGEFTTAGGVAARNIARWNGSSWSALGGGLDGPVYPKVNALAVYDDGTGPALYAAGDFETADGVLISDIARWDGSSWSALGTGVGGDSSSSVYALTVFDDGSGPALYVGGSFQEAGGVTVNGIAKWDGAYWSALGTGVSQGGVTALAAYDDGTGPALFVGGYFDSAGGVDADEIAKWDGTNWSALGNGLGNGSVYDLAVYDGGAGPVLIAGGSFTYLGTSANSVAAWNGTEWSALGDGMVGDGYGAIVHALRVHDDQSGDGPKLYAGGRFDTAGGATANRIAQWDGVDWSPVAGGMGTVPSSGGVFALAAYTSDPEIAPQLIAGGVFASAGDVPVENLAQWDGNEWSGVGHGLSDSASPRINDLVVLDDGSPDGPVLYAGGRFTMAGGVVANHIAMWDGWRWHSLDGGVSGTGGPGVWCLAVFDDGNGPALYAGGAFTSAGGVPANYIARWNGSEWFQVGDGMRNAVSALAVYDDGLGGGPALYAGGDFTSLPDGTSARYIAKWDGVSWSGVGGGMDERVRALAVFDDGLGGGPALYAGGVFDRADWNSANHIAKWDGVEWSRLGAGVSGSGYDTDVVALVAFDGWFGPTKQNDPASPSGNPNLYVGGQFTTAGGVTVNHIAKWDGVAWSPIGTGMDSDASITVVALEVFDDGSGDGYALYAGGLFTNAGGVEANLVAKWNGTEWSDVGGSFGEDVEGAVNKLLVFDDGTEFGESLYVGGGFNASPSGDSYITRWDCIPYACTGDIDGDGDTDQSDLGLLLASYELPPDDPFFDPRADLNDDGEVGQPDLGILLADYECAP